MDGQCEENQGTLRYKNCQNNATLYVRTGPTTVFSVGSRWITFQRKADSAMIKNRVNTLLSTMTPKPNLNTSLIHGDEAVENGGSLEVVPPISVTTTFRAPEQDLLAGNDMWNPNPHVYSRYSRNTTTRAEHVLSKITDGYALTYASGLAACFAALIHYQPKRIAIRGGYMGCWASMDVYTRSRNVPIIDIDEEFQAGDLCWLETPVNPTGESRDIRYYADKVHKAGGKIVVDSTFAPPPLQNPFKFGTDCILHSGSKYFGGHSDLLCGVLVVKSKQEWEELQHDRTFLGSMLGSLESWLLLRSLRTLQLRVLRQSENAIVLVRWLQSISLVKKGDSYEGVPGGIITKVYHSALQGKDARGFEPATQLEGGWNATFAILLSTPEQAKALPGSLKYFVPATSLGGVESLVEYRLRADPKENPKLVRLSIGIEEVEDLKNDLREGIKKVATLHSAKL